MNEKMIDRQPQLEETAPAPDPAGQGGALGRAFRQALPIVLGYVPVGFAYGVLAQKSGLSTANTLAMSLIVFAGSAQLIAVGLFAAMASPLSIVLTTFVVNLRHLLMSAALAPHLRSWTKPQIAALTTELTDETFALHIARFAGRKTAAQNRNDGRDRNAPQLPGEPITGKATGAATPAGSATLPIANSAETATAATPILPPDQVQAHWGNRPPGQAPDYPAPAPTAPGSAACPRLAGSIARIAPRIGAADPRLALDTPAGPSARADARPMVPPSGATPLSAAPATATSGPTGSSPAGPGPAGSDKAEMFCVNLISQTSWVAGTWLGLVSSALVADVRPVGLDYALPAMFLALLAMQLRTRTHWLVAGAAGFGSVALLSAGVDRWNVMLATVAAAALGAGVETWTKRRSS